MSNIAFLFPGQGSQSVGMGKSICLNYSVAKETFKEASDVLGLDMEHLCSADCMEDELTDSKGGQLAVVTMSIASYRVCEEEMGLVPTLGAGHSLGEISALTCSGAITFSDALKIVRIRSRLMQSIADENIGGRALVLGLDRALIDHIAKDAAKDRQQVEVSNHNSFDQIVVSGKMESLDAFKHKVVDFGGEYIPFSLIPMMVDAPFHSSLMKDTAERLRDELACFTFHPMQWPVISSAMVKPYENHGRVVELLSQQMCSPVEWYRTIEFIKDRGVDGFLVVGYGDTLTNIYRSSDKSRSTLKMFSFCNEYVQFKEMMWRRFLPYLLGIIVSTAQRIRNKLDYEETVIVPHRQLQDLGRKIDQFEGVPSELDLKKGLTLFTDILNAKGLNREEIMEIVANVIKDTGTKILLDNT